MKIERTYKVDMRSTKEDSREVEGYAVVFNEPTTIDWFVEEIDPHAFDETDMSNVYLLANHDPNNVLAGTSNGSLVWDIDEKGVYQRATITETGTGEDWLRLVKDGLINKQSFAFTIDPDDEEWTEVDGIPHRYIHRVKKCWDFSLVTYPAYNGTSAFARSENETDELAKDHKRRMEQAERLERLLHGKSNE